MFFSIKIIATTTLTTHHIDHTTKSSYIPRKVNPIIADRPNNIIIAILPPLPFDFLVATETIPPASIRKPQRIPVEPEIPPVSSIASTIPTAHD